MKDLIKIKKSKPEKWETKLEFKDDKVVGGTRSRTHEGSIIFNLRNHWGTDSTVSDLIKALGEFNPNAYVEIHVEDDDMETLFISHTETQHLSEADIIKEDEKFQKRLFQEKKADELRKKIEVKTYKAKLGHEVCRLLVEQGEDENDLQLLKRVYDELTN